MNIKQLIVGPIQTNCYILTEGSHVVVIDPGGDIDEIAPFIDKEIDDIEDFRIVNTHHHHDHVLANEVLKTEFDGKILIHEDEKDYIDFEVDEFLKEGDEIQIGESTLQVIHTPGHTQGCICLLGEDLLFSGDTIFDQGVGRTDLPGGDISKLEESIQKLSKMVANGITVYPGHGSKFIWNH